MEIGAESGIFEGQPRRGNSEDNTSFLVLDAAEQREIFEPLRRQGYGVTRAATLSEYISCLWKLTPRCVLIAAGDSRFSPCDAMAVTKQLAPNSRIALWSTYSAISKVSCALSAGATAILSKPTSWQNILSTFGLPHRADDTSTSSLESAKQRYIEEILHQCESVSQAAKLLGIDRKSLRRVLKRYSQTALPDSEIACWYRRKEAHLARRGFSSETP